MRISWTSALVASSLAMSTAMAAVPRETQIVMAQDQGCTLLVLYEVKPATSGSADVLVVRPKTSWPLCGALNSNRPGLASVPTTDHIMVLYGGLLPIDSTYRFENFPLCVMGPQQLVPEGDKIIAPFEQQAIKLDGTTYLFTSDSIYNMTPPYTDGAAPSFPKLETYCHPKGDQGNIDAMVFANNQELLKTLPNPYRTDVQAKAHDGWEEPSWASTAFTITPAVQTATQTQSPQ